MMKRLLLLCFISVYGQIGPTINLQFDSTVQQFFVKHPHSEISKKTFKDSASLGWNYIQEQDFSCPHDRKISTNVCNEEYCEIKLSCQSHAAIRYNAPNLYAFGDMRFKRGKQYYFEVMLPKSSLINHRIGIATAHALQPGADQHREWTIGTDGSWSVAGAINKAQDPQEETLWGSGSYDGLNMEHNDQAYGIFVNLVGSNPQVTFYPIPAWCRSNLDKECASDADLKPPNLNYNLTLSIDGFQRILQTAPKEKEAVDLKNGYKGWKPKLTDPPKRFGHDAFNRMIMDDKGIAMPKLLKINAKNFEFEPARFGSDLPTNAPIFTNLVRSIPSLGCEPFRNTKAMKNNVAFIVRGQCDFVVKAMHAQAAGAVAVVIGNNIDDKQVGASELVIMDAGGHKDAKNVHIPCLFVARLSTGTIQTLFAQADHKNEKLWATISGPLNAPGHHGKLWKQDGLIPMIWTSSDEVSIRHYKKVPQWVTPARYFPENALGCRPLNYFPLNKINHGNWESRSHPNFSPNDFPQVQFWKSASKRLIRSAIVCGERFLKQLHLPSSTVDLSRFNFAPWLQLTENRIAYYRGTPGWDNLPNTSQDELNACMVSMQLIRVSGFDHAGNRLNGAQLEFYFKGTVSEKVRQFTCGVGRISSSGPSHYVPFTMDSMKNTIPLIQEDPYNAGLRKKALYMFSVDVNCQIMDHENIKQNVQPQLHVGISSMYNILHTDPRFREFSVSSHGYLKMKTLTTGAADQSYHPLDKTKDFCERAFSRLTVVVDVNAGVITFVMGKTKGENSDGTFDDPTFEQHYIEVSFQENLPHGTTVDRMQPIAWGWGKTKQYPEISDKEYQPFSPFIPSIKFESTMKGIAAVKYSPRVVEYTSETALKLLQELKDAITECTSLRYGAIKCQRLK